MTPFVKRNLLIPIAATLLALTLYCLLVLVPVLRGQLQHSFLLVISLLMMLAVIAMLAWSILGIFGGLFCLLVIMIFIYRPLISLDPYYYSVLILAFFLNGFIGHHINRSINRALQGYKVKSEKVNEDINLINDHYKNRVAEISAMEEKISSLLKLKSISDKLSMSLSRDEVINIALDSIFDRFHKDVRVFFYKVSEDNVVSLVDMLKPEYRTSTELKAGGIFERWVLKNMQVLIVRDVKEDYRFSVTSGQDSVDFTSLISKPLVSEGRILGILRVDSDKVEAFSQHDLRVLDIIGELTTVAMENAKLYSKTKELAIKDSLTGLYVHRYFMERFEEEIRRSLRSGNSFGLLMMDIDDFKKFNDEYGHIAGDIALKSTSAVLKDKISAGDVVCRYGGEEFALIKLNCSRQEAIDLAETISKEVSSNMIDIRREEKAITISTGVAMFPDDSKVREDLIWEADKRLYQAKSKGKNRVCSK